MSQSNNSAKCPACGSFVNPRADKCPYCRSSLKHTSPSGSMFPTDFGKSIAESVKLELRHELDDSLGAFRQSGPPYEMVGKAGPAPTTATLTSFAMPEQVEEYATSQLSIISYGPQFLVEFRRRKASPGEIVEVRPLQATINEETVKGLQEVYIGHILKNIRRAALGQSNLYNDFQGNLVSFGQILSNALSKEIVGSIASLSVGSRIQLRLDERALGIPWDLAWLGDWVDPKVGDERFLGIRYSIGKTVVWTPSPGDSLPQTNTRQPSPKTSVLMIDAATDPYEDPRLQSISSFKPVIEYFERVLKSRGVTVRTMWGAQAKATEVCEALKDDNDIVIINTHGNFDEQESATGLAMHDRTLSCKEIREVYRDSKHPPPLLWVSYACETGTQRAWPEGGEDSLPTTLNKLNVPLLAPYWPAFAGPSDTLLANFFAEIFNRTPSTIGDALLHAKRDLKEKVDKAQAMNWDWANWALYGSPSLAIGLRE